MILEFSSFERTIMGAYKNKPKIKYYKKTKIPTVHGFHSKFPMRDNGPVYVLSRYSVLNTSLKGLGGSGSDIFNMLHVLK